MKTFDFRLSEQEAMIILNLLRGCGPQELKAVGLDSKIDKEIIQRLISFMEEIIFGLLTKEGFRIKTDQNHSNQ